MKKRFSFLERLKHYTDVASGKKPTKRNSKYSDREQRIYAKGRRDELNKQRCTYAFFKKKQDNYKNDNRNFQAKEKRDDYIDDLYLKSVGNDYHQMTKGAYKDSFKMGFDSVMKKPYSEKAYERSKIAYEDCKKELSTVDDRNRGYVWSKYASELGAMRAYELKNKQN